MMNFRYVSLADIRQYPLWVETSRVHGKWLKIFCDVLFAHLPIPLCAASFSRKQAEV
jgi:hypothetical protein